MESHPASFLYCDINRPCGFFFIKYMTFKGERLTGTKCRVDGIGGRFFGNINIESLKNSSK